MKEIKKYLESREGQFSFYFEALNGEYTYGYNENMVIPAAGCIKLPIAIALLKEVENGNINLDSKIKVDKTDMEEGGTGIIHEFIGKEYSVLELLVAMLIQSDNTAANKIIDVLGKDSINKTIALMGLKCTQLNTKTTDTKLDIEKEENLSTSYELSKCFKVIYERKFLNEEHSDLILKILSRQQQRSKIPFYIPREHWQNICNKAGSLNVIENDSAIFRLEKGDFIFTIMCKNVPSNVYGSITISRVAKMMWDMLEKDWK